MTASPGFAQDTQAQVDVQQDEPTPLDIPAPPPGANLPEVEPIISDEEFEESVPELAPEDDPELDGPLESIAEFERRLAAEEAEAQTAEGQAPPLNDPALADGDPVE